MYQAVGELYIELPPNFNFSSCSFIAQGGQGEIRRDPNFNGMDCAIKKIDSLGHFSTAKARQISVHLYDLIISSFHYFLPSFSPVRMRPDEVCIKK